ncbi:replication protein [Paenibacillus graminis]|uniref:replication protein n=1 Tax=Paenibacillus graminis TaxID=189425 RepID=UPI000472607C|nr:replication protein [Paenibacillus graminis]
MEGPQLEDGYTRVANEILEQVARRKFNATQLRIIMIIWRYTYGYRRKDHDFALTFLQQLTSLPASTVKREVGLLIKSAVLIVTQKETSVLPRRLSFNKHYEQWIIQKSGDEMEQEHDLFTSSEVSDLNPPESEDSEIRGIRFDTPEVSDLSPQVDVSRYQIRPPLKEIKILKKSFKEKIARFDDFYQNYPRKVSKDAAKKAWEKLCKIEGLDTDMVIQNTANFTETCKLLQTEKKYIPHPSTFLNQKRYEDYTVVDPEGLLKPAILETKNTGDVIDRAMQRELNNSGSDRRDGYSEVSPLGIPQLCD